MFIGREKEIELLENLRGNKRANLVVCHGRRRIGKSTLFSEFGKSELFYISFQGLAPAKGMTGQDQLGYFMKQLSDQLKFPLIKVTDWDTAFTLLAKYTENKKVTILFDEISWMGHYDKKFSSILKAVWDRNFSVNKQLILILCGSVSSWIEDNILKSSNFVGRISKEINLSEIPLNLCSKFWGKYQNKVPVIDKLKYLCIVGGVPRYLDEAPKTVQITELVSTLCFRPDGFFFGEFDRIFADIFEKKSNRYRKIVETLLLGKKTFTQICEIIQESPTGKITILLRHLELAGFIKGTRNWGLMSGKEGKIIYYRLSDNYLRFYLKYIMPNKKKIEAGLFAYPEIDMLPQIETIYGLQLENLILNNISLVIEKLKINKKEIINWGPYHQTATKRNKGCQIDLLIHCKDILYLCEIKMQKKISNKVATELTEKKQRLKYDKNKYLIKTVLIFAGGQSPSLQENEDVDYSLDIKKML